MLLYFLRLMLELFHHFTIKSNSNNLEVRLLLYRLDILQLMNEGVKKWDTHFHQNSTQKN